MGVSKTQGHLPQTPNSQALIKKDTHKEDPIHRNSQLSGYAISGPGCCGRLAAFDGLTYGGGSVGGCP